MTRHNGLVALKDNLVISEHQGTSIKEPSYIVLSSPSAYKKSMMNSKVICTEIVVNGGHQSTNKT